MEILRIFKRLSIKKLTLKDYIVNFYLRLRFQFYRLFWKSKLNNNSQRIKDNLKLTFEDDFDSLSWGLSDSKWIVGEGWGAFHPEKTDVYFGAPTYVEDESYALFTVKHKPKEFELYNNKITIPFEVSLLSTERTFEQMYGRFECRMTLPKAVGAWAAFWMWGPTHPPEIDMIEAYGKESGLDTRYQKINLHYGEGENKTNMKSWTVKVDKKSGVGKNYHEFAVEWKPNSIEIYTDGIKVFQYTGKKVLDKWFNKPDTIMRVIIGNSLFSGFIDNNDSEYYSEFKVDYIRAYTFN